MMAQLSGAGPFDFGPAFRYTVQYSLFGALWLGAVVATVLQVAINDGNYYEMINGAQNLIGQVPGWRRWYTCLLMTAVAVLATWWFVHVENGFFRIAGYSAIALPCATVVIGVDQFRPAAAPQDQPPGATDPGLAVGRPRQLARDRRGCLSRCSSGRGGRRCCPGRPPRPRWASFP